MQAVAESSRFFSTADEKVWSVASRGRAWASSISGREAPDGEGALPVRRSLWSYGHLWLPFGEVGSPRAAKAFPKPIVHFRP
jgi:hypothetical protein